MTRATRDELNELPNFRSHALFDGFAVLNPLLCTIYANRAPSSAATGLPHGHDFAARDGREPRARGPIRVDGPGYFFFAGFFAIFLAGAFFGAFLAFMVPGPFAGMVSSSLIRNFDRRFLYFRILQRRRLFQMCARRFTVCDAHH